MNYFLPNVKIKNIKREFINYRKKRKSILGIPSMGKLFNTGDILTVNFWAKTFRYHFEGICLAMKKKKIMNHNMTLTLRNVIFGTGIEMLMSYYYNRLFKNTFTSDYKRKNFNYNSSKLYYLRFRQNQATKI